MREPVSHKCGPAYSCQSCHRLHCFECDAHMPGATEYKTIANRFCKSDACAIAKQAFAAAPRLSNERLLQHASRLTLREVEMALAELRERRMYAQEVLDAQRERLGEPPRADEPWLHELKERMVVSQGIGAFFGSLLGKFIRPTEPQPWFHMGTSDEHVPPRSTEAG